MAMDIPQIYRLGDVGQIHVNVHERPGVRADQNDPKVSFWKTAHNVKQGRYDNNINYKFEDDSTFEAVLKQNFGIALKSRLINFFAESWIASGTGDSGRDGELPDEFTSKRLALGGIFFQVVNIRYGTLSYDVDIAGIKNIVELFNNNYALFGSVRQVML